jgi:hypothetical protein
MAEASVEQVAAPPPSSSQQFSFMSNLLVSQVGRAGKGSGTGYERDTPSPHRVRPRRSSYKHVEACGAERIVTSLCIYVVDKLRSHTQILLPLPHTGRRRGGDGR